MHAKIIAKGIVQGVGFRPFIYRAALDNKLVGYVRNRGDAGVEIVVEGSEGNVKNFIDGIKEKKPSLSQVYDISVRYSQDKHEFVKFSIEKSFEGGSLHGSVIPYDVSICDKCVGELLNRENRRHDYFFITCTECGPRYTIIEKLPYDRPNTTMSDFPMCEECKVEYINPFDRRFHAQTIACKKCGPKVSLIDNNGEHVATDDPIREASMLIGEGYIVAVKGNGGFHLATSTTRTEPIMRLRNVKHRSQKPFAVMAHNLEAVKSFAEVNDFEIELLTSSARPVLLLKKNNEYWLSELVSPGLHNIGVMLPYTGLHYMLFDRAKEPAFVMTSANPPSEPIVTDNEEALEKLGKVVDFFLFHNRDIAQRCDDSVVRALCREKRIIRRSRGYTPSPIHLRNPGKHPALGIGAEENVNTCLLLGNKAFTSQYIGDVENLETLRFLEETVKHIVKMTKGEISAIGCDLHPMFSTTRLALEFGMEFKCPIFKIQHHYAHLLSLMAEKGSDELVGIVCDGAGYGSDGKIWGGEVLHCTLENFSRLGHLQEQPMVGGDLVAKYPLRMAACILNKAVDIREWVLSKASHFPRGEREVNVFLKQIENGPMPLTSSCGRVLDAVSALLDICYIRTYEGEAAMKLESAAFHGDDILKLNPRIRRGIIDTTCLVLEIFENRDRYSAADLAYSAEEYIAESLAELAVDEAGRVGVGVVGFSGGVAYNEHITQAIRRIVEDSRLKFLVHDQVPPGDGGISLGQAFAASNSL
ncbi:MAG: carbamoyltransferase HypF [Candidatus Bathyarchaeota archaeon]